MLDIEELRREGFYLAFVGKLHEEGSKIESVIDFIRDKYRGKNGFRVDVHIENNLKDLDEYVANLKEIIEAIRSI